MSKTQYFLAAPSPRGSWDGRVEAGVDVDYRWILHRSARPDHQLHQRPPASLTTTSFINDHQLHQRPPASSTTTSFINDHQLHQRPATIIKAPPKPTPPVNSP
ncbi:hypothetical protein N7450_011627 [Penicillium hetheringtonii]|uniref:Uncharacterized protein n=1 Tax=Penicillium hetheringtonii TaxID=911720 RepID=A0AAD6DAB0_9EURO|nr:hypothetical protein N7450_011627 [Penicillium hetheringtonii]